MSSSPNIPELPQDIIDEIVRAFAYVTNADKPQLSKLALTSRSFLPPCQKYIFETIELVRAGSRSHLHPHHPSGPGVDILGTRLHECLQTSPHLFSYIRSLKMYAWSTGETDWVVAEKSASIIRACTRLHTFEIGAEFRCDWSKMDPAMQSSLTSLVVSSRLSHLALNGIREIPQALFPFFGSLETLRLNKVTASPESGIENGECPATSSNSRNEVSLKSLSISVPNPTLQLILNQIPLSRLLVLDADYGQVEGAPFLLRDLLQKAVSIIQDLHIIVLCHAPLTLSIIDVAPYRNLRSVSLLTSLEFIEDTFACMKRLVATSSSLETATVMISTPLWKDNVMLEFMDNVMYIWEDFQPPPSLRCLVLHLYLAQLQDRKDLDHILYAHTFGNILQKATEGRANLSSLIHQSRVRIAYDICSGFSQFVFRDEAMLIRRREIEDPAREVAQWKSWT